MSQMRRQNREEEMKSQTIDNIVESVLLKYKEGQNFFSNLDLSFRNKLVIDILFAQLSDKYKIVASGSFGETVAKIKRIDLLLPGNLRHMTKYDLSNWRDKIKNQDFIFVDDSYYSGRTVNIVRKAIEEQKGNLVKTFAIYDGKKVLDKDVESFYRYFNHYF